MTEYLLKVKKGLKIPKSYNQDELAQYQGSYGHNASSDEFELLAILEANFCPNTFLVPLHLPNCLLLFMTSRMRSAIMCSGLVLGVISIIFLG